MFAPIREIPLPESLLCELWKFPITSPGIQRPVVEQEVRCVIQRRLGSLFYDVVFLGVSEYVSGNCK